MEVDAVVAEAEIVGVDVVFVTPPPNELVVTLPVVAHGHAEGAVGHRQTVVVLTAISVVVDDFVMVVVAAKEDA